MDGRGHYETLSDLISVTIALCHTTEQLQNNYSQSSHSGLLSLWEDQVSILFLHVSMLNTYILTDIKVTNIMALLVISNVGVAPYFKLTSYHGL